jgi:hypothetical protein
MVLATSSFSKKKREVLRILDIRTMFVTNVDNLGFHNLAGAHTNPYITLQAILPVESESFIDG